MPSLLPDSDDDSTMPSLLPQWERYDSDSDDVDSYAEHSCVVTTRLFASVTVDTQFDDTGADLSDLPTEEIGSRRTRTGCCLVLRAPLTLPDQKFSRTATRAVK
jgi:hypothetical protein